MTTLPTQHPIIFTGEMVKAILEGRKTQTRRPVKPQPDYFVHGAPCKGKPVDSMQDVIFCPYGQPGDRLYIKRNKRGFNWDKRIVLEITAVRVERVQDIDESSAEAEGAPLGGYNDHFGDERNYVEGFEALWDSIYAKTYPWSANPWVWVIEFKRVKEVK